MEGLQKLVGGFTNLFGEQGGEYDGDAEGSPGYSPDEFVEYWGWYANNVQIAELYRITLNEVFEMPVMEALNALGYIKARQEWEQKKREDAERTSGGNR